jgi:hypothetical protein
MLPRPVWSLFVTWTNADARLVWVRPGRLGAIATAQVFLQQRKCLPANREIDLVNQIARDTDCRFRLAPA